jgi:hypothetical protein
VIWRQLTSGAFAATGTAGSYLVFAVQVGFARQWWAATSGPHLATVLASPSAAQQMCQAWESRPEPDA